MRRNPTEAEKIYGARCRTASWQGTNSAGRQAVIGPYIADFLCPQRALIVEVDGDTHDAEQDRWRDATLADHGFQILRVTNRDVMSNQEGVLTAVLHALNEASDRWERPHPNPSPEGEGLKVAEAQKLLGISLEGSVG